VIERELTLSNRNTTFFSVPAWARQVLEEVHRLSGEGLPPELVPLCEGQGGRELLPTPSPLRPLLLLVAARRYGCTGPRPVRMAAAIQMIHMAALLHERLGALPGQLLPASGLAANAPAPAPDLRKMRHRQESLDILLGDFFFARASGIIIEDGSRAVIADMIRTSMASAEAQAVIAGVMEDREPGTPDRCSAARQDKVSLLLALALRTGAVLADAPAEEKEALSEFGLFFGCALRVMRDLAMWRQLSGAAAPHPKALAYSRPLVVLWRRDGHEAWQEALSRLTAPGCMGVPLVRGLLEERGCLAAAKEEAQSLTEQAVARLPVRAGVPGEDELKEMAQDLIRQPPEDWKEDLW
jgi:octaprenyl-diphosphate synthase